MICSLAGITVLHKILHVSPEVIPVIHLSNLFICLVTPQMSSYTIKYHVTLISVAKAQVDLAS